MMILPAGAIRTGICSRTIIEEPEMIQKLQEFIQCRNIEKWEDTDNYRISVQLFFLMLLPIFFGRLGEYHLLKSDELQYATYAKEILQLGDWFTMHYNGEPNWLKPPLYFWIEAVLFKIFGQSEYWARFPSAVTGYATLILIYALGVRLYGRRTALLSIVVLVTSLFFLKFSRRAMLEVPITFSTTLGIYALVRGEDDKKFDLLFGLAIALGYYFKAVQGLYIIAIGPLYLVLTGQWKRIVRPSMLLAYTVAAALMAAWVLPQILMNGEKFIYSSSGIYPIIHRGYFCANPSEQTPIYLPLTMLLKVDVPWIPVSVFGIVLLFRDGLRRRGSLLVLIWTGIILAALMVARNVFDRYLVAVIPPLSLCAGIALARWIKGDRFCVFCRVGMILLIVVLLVALCFPTPIGRKGYEQIDLVKSINYFVPRNETILLYKGHGWATSQALSFYADRYLNKQINSVEDLALERKSRTGKLYCIVSSDDFPEIENSPMKDWTRIILRTGPYGKSQIQYLLIEVLADNGT